MKKLTSALLAIMMVVSLSVPAFAAEPFSAAELAAAQEIGQSVTAYIEHEDGTQTILQPEYRLTKVKDGSRRSSEGQQYALEFMQTYGVGSDSDQDTAKADATLWGCIWYTKGLNTVLDKVELRCTAGSGVQVYNRTATYGATFDKVTHEFPMGTYEDKDCRFGSEPGHGVFLNASASVESYGVTDKMSISAKS